MSIAILSLPEASVDDLIALVGKANMGMRQNLLSPYLGAHQHPCLVAIGSFFFGGPGFCQMNHMIHENLRSRIEKKSGSGTPNGWVDNSSFFMIVLPF